MGRSTRSKTWARLYLRDLRELVLASDRNACLKKLHERAVVELNGH